MLLEGGEQVGRSLFILKEQVLQGSERRGGGGSSRQVVRIIEIPNPMILLWPTRSSKIYFSF